MAAEEVIGLGSGRGLSAFALRYGGQVGAACPLKLKERRRAGSFVSFG